MDKNAIKKYAVWARRELISRVSQKALQYGITDKDIAPAAATSVNGIVLSAEEQKQRKALIEQINSKGYKQVMEEVAYTWFNRFIALRFMEVNGYLPSHVRVFTDEENQFRPQILAEAIHLELDGLDMEKVYTYKEANDDEGLFKYLIIVQCNALNPVMPGMFQRIADDTELLFPDNLLREGSAIQQMIAMIPEEDWKDAVQIIGWLYQYYNSEKKDEVFAALKKNVKITKENIPAATQLFTPDWIVRYMVENSLGRLWLEGHPDAKVQLLPAQEARSAYAAGNRDPEDTKWYYYLEEAEQEPEVETQLAQIRKEYAALTPEQIKVIDPCMGSGHILVYAFDVLMRIYESQGWSQRDAARSILENNLYGLDIDDRAAQLAYFAVMMKARQYDRRILTRGIRPNLFSVAESDGFRQPQLQYFGLGLSELERNNARNQAGALVDALRGAKDLGSLAAVEAMDWDLLRRFAGDVELEGQIALDSLGLEDTQAWLNRLIEVGELLSRRYDVVVTNPPYMGSANMSAKLSDFVKKHYPDSKSDLFAAFMERCGQMTAQNRYQAMITQHAWMFLSSFEKLRTKLLAVDTVNMVHLGARAFEEIGGEVVQTTSFVLRRSHVDDYGGTYCRLVEPTTQQGKEDMFLAGQAQYVSKQDNFSKIPGGPIAYWISVSIFNLFNKCRKLSDIGDLKVGISTANNNRFVRLWHEVDICKMQLPVDSESKLSEKKWFPFNNGGPTRRWYGNNIEVINWERNGFDIISTGRASIRNRSYYLRKGATWTDISTGKIGVRFFDYGFLFSTVGLCLFSEQHEEYLVALLNSPISVEILNILCPTLHFNIGDIAKMPVLIKRESEVINCVGDCRHLSCDDWDSFETSWDFQRHPLV